MNIHEILSCITIVTLIKVYLAASLITALMFAYDKHLASIQANRISEKHLILASAACGWPGGLLAMKLVRHKIRKLSFQVMMGLAVLVNIFIIYSLIKIAGCDL